MSENIEEKKAAWENQDSLVKDLVTRGAVEFFKTEFPDLKHSFIKDLECVVCMDEGTAHKDMGGEHKLCIAGSGILFPAANNEERLQKVVELFKSQNIKDVTSHGGCGAAGLAYKRDFPEKANEKIDQTVIDDYAKDWSQKVSDELDRTGIPSEHRHIEANDMERPVEFHNARVVYFDNVGGFNPNKEIGLPMGFVISRKYVPADYAAEELKVAVSIAFGGHGFGEMFTAESPFVIVVLCENEESLNATKIEVENVLSTIAQFVEKKIKVDGLVV